MSNCEICTPEKGCTFCEHVREDGHSLVPERGYYYAISYVGGYAVVTGDNGEGTPWITAVICVGNKTMGDWRMMHHWEQAERILHREELESLASAETSHKFTCIMLSQGMMQLSQ